MRKNIKGSRAVAEAVKLCSPKVIASYPITPQTLIVEELSKIVADGELDAECIEVESEFSAISAVIGAAAAGVRPFTSTSSQGLALMNEVLYSVSGMRLPIVMVVANRALSSPLNIWNDHSDAMSVRDCGWLQLWVETNQEAVDTLVQAYKIAENEKVQLPAMVCMDGFYLTHTYEPVDIPESLDGFLPDYKPKHVLDPANPKTFGCMAYPDVFWKFKMEQQNAMDDARGVIKQVHDEFAKKFGRSYGTGFTEMYGDSDTVFVGMGSFCGTMKEAADRAGFSVLRVRSFRPFPAKEVAERLGGKKTVVVLDRSFSYGSAGPLFTEVRNALYGTGNPKVVGYVAGLGGKDVGVDDYIKMVERAGNSEPGSITWWG